MIVWDRGRCEPEGDPQKGLAKGHLAFTLEGTRLKGRWHLARMRPRSGEKTEPWLLIKSDDAFARDRGTRRANRVRPDCFPKPARGGPKAKWPCSCA
jgi:ATP-dependent DNA ligase